MSPSPTLTRLASDSAWATVSNGLNFDQSELNQFTAANLNFDTGGQITVEDVVGPTGISNTVTLDASSQITFNGNSSDFVGLDVRSDDRISINGDLEAADLILDGDHNNTADGNDDIVFASGVQVTSRSTMALRSTTGGLSASGALTLNSADGISIEDSLSASGTLAINADTDAPSTGGTLTVFASMTVSSSNQQITIAAADVDLLGSVDAGTGDVSFRETEGGGISLGTASITGALALTNAELTAISGNDVSFETTGNIEVESVPQSASITGAYRLTANGSSSQITFGAGGASTFLELEANAHAGIRLAGDVDVTNGAVTIDSDADDDGIGDFEVDATGSLTTTNQLLQITANDVELQGLVDTGSVGVTIVSSDSDDIGIGDAVGTGPNLSGAELSLITASQLTLSTGGSIIVDNVSSADSSGFDEIALTASQQIRFENSASTFLAATVSAEDGVDFQTNVTTTSGDFVIEGDSDNGADSIDRIDFSALAQLTSAGQLVLDATSGNMPRRGVAPTDCRQRCHDQRLAVVDRGDPDDRR